MKILHVFDHSIPLQSGYTFRSRAILLEQRRRGWQTFHVTGGKQGAVSSPTEEVDGLTFHRTPPPTGMTAGTPVINQFSIANGLRRRIAQLIEELRPNVIHAHSPALNGVAALAAARATRTPVVYEIRAFWEDAAVDHGTSSENGVRYRLTKMLETRVARQVDGLFTICEGLRRDLVTRGIHERKITVIPNAVDVARFKFNLPRNAGLAEQLGIGDRPVLGFIGSFYGYEGIASLVSALSLVRTAVPQLRVLLVGGGPCHADVMRLVEQLQLSEMVITVGRVPHTEVEDYYSLVDVFCYPRLPMRLTELVTPLKPLEAMAQGKIVLASDVGGHRELIDHERTGVLFPAGDRQAMAAAIIALFSHPERWPSLRNAAREFVERERNWPSSVAHYEAAYRRCGVHE